MITIKTVAKEAGVSKTTVSRVINKQDSISEETKKKVLEAIEKLGYIPNESARNLRLNKNKKDLKTYNIACILFAGYSKFSHPYYSNILEGIDQEAVAHRYQPFIYTEDQLKSDLVLLGKVINPERFDGIIFLSGGIQFLREIEKRLRPIVCISFLLDGVDSIDVDKARAGYDAVKYLVGLGHRRIGFVGDHLDPTDSGRFKGYSKAIGDFGLEYDKSIIEGELHGYSVEQGFKYMNKILERAKPLPTAIFGASDLTAIGAMNAIKSKGLNIPDDISVIGFDDIDQAQHVFPSLTTLRVRKKELGSLAVKRLLERIEHPDLQPVKVILPAELVVRKSCRSIK